MPVCQLYRLWFRKRGKRKKLSEFSASNPNTQILYAISLTEQS
jgi:hypothetical protein